MNLDQPSKNIQRHNQTALVGKYNSQTVNFFQNNLIIQEREKNVGLKNTTEIKLIFK